MAKGSPADFDRIHEIFSGFGPVTVRRMFGGAGVFAGGVMFALVAGDEVFLKADASTSPAFAAEGMGPFAYETGKGKPAVMSYWRIPARLYEDTDELANWARDALTVARRQAASPRTKATPRKSARRRASRSE